MFALPTRGDERGKCVVLDAWRCRKSKGAGQEEIMGYEELDCEEERGGRLKRIRRKER